MSGPWPPGMGSFFFSGISQTSASVVSIRDAMDDAPPWGYAIWNGSLVAEALGGVSKHRVWRVLRSEGIHPQRRRREFHLSSRGAGGD